MGILLGKGVDANAKNSEGQTALHYAAEEGYTNIVAQLLADDADVNVKNKRGETPLALAVLSGRKATVKLLKGAWGHGIEDG